jgi:Tol biopolymer transport system component
VFDLYVKDKGGADERLLWRSPYTKTASDWSRDGKYLIYTEVNPKTGADIWILPNPSGPSSELKPAPFANSQFLESQGQLSPDGRWIAYASDESGQYEVYVRPFPSGEGKWRVSTASGREPRWRGDGKELFYEEGVLGRLRVMAVTVTPGSAPAAGLTFGVPAQMFEFRTSTILPQNNQFSYAPTRDGQRFLFHRLAGDARPILNVLLNWQNLRPR